MRFNKHSELEGLHAFLSASKYHWINYDHDKLVNTYKNYRAAQRGTELHALAKQCIELGINLPRTSKTLNMYINDAIGYKMDTEVVLYYSPFCFGTADSISFKRGLLRIHDLKTGVTPASINQLYIYAALFCLEYKEKPGSIKSELRIYQNDEVLVERADNEFLSHLVDQIITFDKYLTELTMEDE